MTSTEKIFQAFVEFKAIYKGPFVRADGMVLPLWDDAQRVWSEPRIFRLCVRELSKTVRRSKCDAIVGAATAGIPLAAAIAYHTGKRFSFVRKERKGYSARQLLDGYVTPGSRVILVDDAFVRGEMKDVFIRKIEKAGAKVRMIVVLVNVGLAEGVEWLAKRDVALYALYSWPTLFNYLRTRRLITNEFHSILLQFVNNPYGWHKDKEVWQRFLRLRNRQLLWR